MAVFDGVVKVPRCVADPKKDKDLSSPGSLSWGGIKSAAGLAGANGADAKLIHGDRWQQIDGSHIENVNQNLKTTIKGNQDHATIGNQTISVSQDHKETIAGTCLQTIIGPQIVTNIDVRSETRMITHTHTHGDLQMVFDPDNEFHLGETNYGMWSTMFEVESTHIEAAVQHIEVKGGHYFFGGLDTSACLLRLQNKELNAELDTTDSSIKLLKFHVGGLLTKVNSLEAKLQAAEVMTGADANPTPGI